jgi:RNA polymerase sigma factor (sigma-70 family)
VTSTIDAIRRHRGTALGIARGFMRRLPRSVPREDIEQAALIGLFLWKRSHPDEEAPGWIGGLRVRIRGSIIDELRNQAPFSRCAHRAGPLYVDSLETVLPGWENSLPAECVDPAERIDAQRILADAIGVRLSAREAEVIDLVFYRELRQVGVAKKLCVTEARVSQIRSNAIAKMRAKLNRSKPGLAKCGKREEEL